MENTIQTSASPASDASKSGASALPANKTAIVSTEEVVVEMEKARSGVSEVIASTANEVRQAAESLRVNIQQFEPALKITVDDAVDIPVVTVWDESSNELIRQIPKEEIVALARFIESQNFDDYSSRREIRGALLNNRS